MELKQAVKRSEKGSLLQAVASPQVHKKPVTAEPRGSRKVVLPIESELWTGAETISVISIIASVVCSDFYHLDCTPGASLLPFTSIFCSDFHSEGEPTRLLQSS